MHTVEEIRSPNLTGIRVVYDLCTCYRLYAFASASADYADKMRSYDTIRAVRITNDRRIRIKWKLKKKCRISTNFVS